MYPLEFFYATKIDLKGYDVDVVQRLAQFITDIGLVHFADRSDREPAIRSMISEAVVLSGRSGKPRTEFDEPVDDDTSAMDKLNADKNDHDDPSAPESEKVITATPEETMPGESQSNGLAEKAVQQVEDQIRTMKDAHEARLGVRSPNESSHHGVDDRACVALAREVPCRAR